MYLYRFQFTQYHNAYLRLLLSLKFIISNFDIFIVSSFWKWYIQNKNEIDTRTEIEIEHDKSTFFLILICIISLWYERIAYGFDYFQDSNNNFFGWISFNLLDSRNQFFNSFTFDLMWSQTRLFFQYWMLSMTNDHFILLVQSAHENNLFGYFHDNPSIKTISYWLRNT